MEIRYFDPEHDFDILNKWLEIHEHPQVQIHELPKLGYVAVRNNEMMAIGFLRLCEGNFAMTDSFTISPFVKAPKIKAQAFDAITHKLTTVAKDLKISHLLAYTVKQGVVKRSIKVHGFQKVDHILLIKKL